MGAQGRGGGGRGGERGGGAGAAAIDVSSRVGAQRGQLCLVRQIGVSPRQRAGLAMPTLCHFGGSDVRAELHKLSRRLCIRQRGNEVEGGLPDEVEGTLEAFVDGDHLGPGLELEKLPRKFRQIYPPLRGVP